MNNLNSFPKPGRCFVIDQSHTIPSSDEIKPPIIQKITVDGPAMIYEGTAFVIIEVTDEDFSFVPLNSNLPPEIKMVLPQDTPPLIKPSNLYYWAKNYPDRWKQICDVYPAVAEAGF